jgi:hypothetical protein
MKKIVCLFLLLFTNFCYGDYVVNGSGNSRGEAYVDAMSRAPSGSHWEIYRIYYAPNQQLCKITWRSRKK